MSIVITMFYGLIPQLIEETKGLVKVAPQITTQLQNAADNLQAQVSFDLGLDQAFQTIVSKANVETTFNSIFENVKNAGIFLFKIVVALILSYVFIVDRNKIQEFTAGMKH